MPPINLIFVLFTFFQVISEPEEPVVAATTAAETESSKPSRMLEEYLEKELNEMKLDEEDGGKDDVAVDPDLSLDEDDLLLSDD